MKLILEVHDKRPDAAKVKGHYSRRLAAEEAKEKPTAPASLVEELCAWVNAEDKNGFTAAKMKVSGILSRYRPVNDSALGDELETYLHKINAEGEALRSVDIEEIIRKHRGAK